MIKISFFFYNKTPQETERYSQVSPWISGDLLAEAQHPVRICISEKFHDLIKLFSLLIRSARYIYLRSPREMQGKP